MEYTATIHYTLNGFNGTQHKALEAKGGLSWCISYVKGVIDELICYSVDSINIVPSSNLESYGA